MQKTFIIISERTDKVSDYNHNTFNLGLPVDMPHLKAQFFVMDGEDIGVYCEVDVSDPFPDFIDTFLANYGKFLCLTNSPDKILKKFLSLYPEALTWGETVDILRARLGSNFDSYDPKLFRVDAGLANFIRTAINCDAAYINVLLQRNEILKNLFRSVYESNGGGRADVWEELARSNRADFINFVLLFPDSLNAVDSKNIFAKFRNELRDWLY